MGNRVAVLGGGASGQMFAADLTLAGWDVHLYELPEFRDNIENLLTEKKIEILGEQDNARNFKRSGIASIKLVTCDMEEALNGVDLVNICIPAFGHKKVFEKMIPFLKDGLIISIFPDNFGSLLLRKLLRDNHININLVIGGWNNMPGGFRLIKPGKVYCNRRSIAIRGDTLPSKDWTHFINIMKNFPLFDPIEITHGDTIIDIGLSNVNAVLHSVGTLLSVSAMENAPPRSFDLYRDGYTPSVVKAMIPFHNEECLIAEKLGIKMFYRSEEFFRSRAHFVIGEVDKERMIPAGPYSIESRYLTEDVPIGAGARYSIAKYLSLDVPIIESVIHLASAVCGRDFLKECRSVKQMGISEISKDHILNYLKEGILVSQ